MNLLDRLSTRASGLDEVPEVVRPEQPHRYALARDDGGLEEQMEATLSDEGDPAAPPVRAERPLSLVPARAASQPSRLRLERLSTATGDEPEPLRDRPARDADTGAPPPLAAKLVAQEAARQSDRVLPTPPPPVLVPPLAPAAVVRPSQSSVDVARASLPVDRPDENEARTSERFARLDAAQRDLRDRLDRLEAPAAGAPASPETPAPPPVRAAAAPEPPDAAPLEQIVIGRVRVEIVEPPRAPAPPPLPPRRSVRSSGPAPAPAPRSYVPMGARFGWRQS